MQKNEARLQLLIDTGLLLARERSLDVIAQAALDTGLQLCGAESGAFFYETANGDGPQIPIYKLSGTATAATSGFTLPRPREMFTSTTTGSGILRSDDITLDPSYAHDSPHAHVARHHLSGKSYLAVPVQSRGGEVFGGIHYGHPTPGSFHAECEPLLAIIAAQAAVAIDNIRLAETLKREIAVADAARRLQHDTAKRLAEVFEATTDGVFLLDREWRFTYLNRRAIALIAQGRDLVGQNVWQAFPAAMGSAFQQRYAEAMDHGTVTEFTELYVPLGLWFSVRAYPTAEGIAAFFQDVTHARELEQERADSARRLRQALDAAQLGTWTWDATTGLVDFDERGAELFGVEPHVPVSRDAVRQRIVHQEDIGLAADDLRQVLLSGGAYNAEYRIEGPNSPSRWIAAHGLGNLDPKTDQISGMIGTVQDITARKTQEATLRQSEKLAATGRLAATIAHEINNPLEAVTNLIYLAKTDSAVPTPVQHLLETADSELARVAQIAQQTLGFYRDTTRPVDINITELLTGVVNLFSRKMQYRHIECALDLAPDLHIFGLQGEMRQVFSNLLVNAIDAAPAGVQRSTIRVRARHSTRNRKPGVSILIADQGGGIPASIRGRLFSPFFTTKQSVGTGLGLWVTRGIVEKQGGSVSFRTCTEEPATGTVFRVFLPAESRESEAAAAPQSHLIQ